MAASEIRGDWPAIWGGTMAVRTGQNLRWNWFSSSTKDEHEEQKMPTGLLAHRREAVGQGMDQPSKTIQWKWIIQHLCTHISVVLSTKVMTPEQQLNKL